MATVYASRAGGKVCAVLEKPDPRLDYQVNVVGDLISVTIPDTHELAKHVKDDKTPTVLDNRFVAADGSIYTRTPGA